MCGILGSFSRTPSPDLDERLRSALHLLRHRGPNDSGLDHFSISAGHVSFGHTRLSIIDLSSNGHQPMHSEDGRHIIVFNGEIYNYADLRQELSALGHKFKSDSDTEVLLAAWTTWGTMCLARLTGMFAFVVLDRQTQTLTCVRDAFGIKPFFYSLSDGFQFASEAPALLAIHQGRPKLNVQRAYDYLVHGDYDSRSDTFFEGVMHLMPGHLMVVQLGEKLSLPQPQRWWTPKIEQGLDLGFNDAVEHVRELFLQSIRFHLRSDVPLGAALSGGIDSSAVVCAMRHVEPDLDIHTFSYVAQGSDENEEVWVDMVNAHVGAKGHKVIVTGTELARDLDDMIKVQGEPFGSTSIYAQYRVYQLASEHGITVTLDGQGADEMLAGYNGYPGPRLRSILETQGPVAAWRFLNAWSQWPGRNKLDGFKFMAGEYAKGSLYQILRRMNGRSLTPNWLRTEPLINAGVLTRHPKQSPELDIEGRRLMAELAFSLNHRGIPSLLRHGDRNSMRFSIESRVPFLTLEQAEFLLSVPENFLISDSGETKSIFRAAMRGIVPDAILNRRDKIGFQTPERAWLFSIAEEVRKWLSADIGLPFLDQPAIVAEFDEIIAGRKPFSWQAWRWINFIRWHQQFLA